MATVGVRGKTQPHSLHLSNYLLRPRGKAPLQPRTYPHVVHMLPAQHHSMCNDRDATNFGRWASILYSFCTGVKQTCRWQGDALESLWTMPSSSPRSPIFAALIRSTFYFAFHASVRCVSSCVCPRHDRNRANSPENALCSSFWTEASV
jgi:hypothetical protein